jgi:integrase
MGLRAGEILALTVDDLDFKHKTIRVNKSADDLTRIVRQPKTKCSIAVLPMPSDLESVLRNYLMAHWKPNSKGILFPNKSGTLSRSRNNVVLFGLHPVLRKLGIPIQRTARLPPRACNAASRGKRPAVSALKATAALGRCDHTADLHTRHTTEPTRRNGERNASIGTKQRISAGNCC